jgi:hypothetical protein
LLIAFPNADDGVRESRIAQKQNPKTQESEAKHPAFLQNQTLYARPIPLISLVDPHSSRTTLYSAPSG